MVDEVKLEEKAYTGSNYKDQNSLLMRGQVDMNGCKLICDYTNQFTILLKQE